MENFMNKNNKIKIPMFGMGKRFPKWSFKKICVFI